MLYGGNDAFGVAPTLCGLVHERFLLGRVLLFSRILQIELLSDTRHDGDRACVRATKIRKVWSRFGTQEGRRVKATQLLSTLIKCAS